MECNAKISIKKLTDNDVNDNFDIICKLLESSYKKSFHTYKVEKNYFTNKVKDLQGYIINDDAIVFGAFNNKLIGLIWCYPRLFLNEERLHVNHFVINELFRGSGIGSILIEKVEQYAVENGIKAIDLMVTKESSSVKFYKDNKFTVERYQMLKKV